MGQAAAKVVAGRVAGQAREDLRLSSQAPKCPRMQNAGAVAGEWGAIRMRRLDEGTARETGPFFACNGDGYGQPRGWFCLDVGDCGSPNIRLDSSPGSRLVISQLPIPMRNRLTSLWTITNAAPARCYKVAHTANWTTPVLRLYHPAEFSRRPAQRRNPRPDVPTLQRTGIHTDRRQA